MKRRTLLPFSLIALLTIGGTAAASAAPYYPDQGAVGKKYCVARAEPAGGTAMPVATCYSSFAASIFAATSGRVRLPASAKPGSVTPDQLNATGDDPPPPTTFVLSIDWVNVNFTGPSLTWEQTSKCGSFQASSMPSGWNDVVSSVETFSGCANTLYQNTNFGGNTFSIGRNSSAATLGSLNDETSSQKWCTSKPCG
jgi:peptidase inhibitor family I36